MVDWFVGYAPPADAYKAQIDQALKGVDTFKSLAERQAKDPKNVEVLFKLARKQADLDRTDKASELYKQVLALDPDGKRGTTEYSPGRGAAPEKVTYTQSAEFNLGLAALFARPPDRAPLQAFIAKYKSGAMVKDAYGRLSAAYFRRTAPKDEAAKFYEEWAARFPDDLTPYSAWVQRIIQDKEPVDKGIELAGKAIALAKAEAGKALESGRPGMAPPVSPVPGLYLSLAQLYGLKGDKGRALEAVEGARKEAAGNERLVPTIAQGYLDAGAEDKALAFYGPDYAKTIGANAAGLATYASFWARQGKNLEDALRAAKKAVEADPKASAAWIALGNVHLKMKNGAEAISAADKAVEAAPPPMKAMIQRQADQIKKQAAEIK